MTTRKRSGRLSRNRSCAPSARGRIISHIADVPIHSAAATLLAGSCIVPSLLPGPNIAKRGTAAGLECCLSRGLGICVALGPGEFVNCWCVSLVYALAVCPLPTNPPAVQYANDVPETIADLKPCLETNTCGRFDAANQSGQGTAYVYYWRSMLRQPNQRSLEHIVCFKSHR